MPIVDLVMPEMGESVTDATISRWLVGVGDTIEEDQDILEVSTDKVDTEVPSPTNGIVKEILHQEGEVVEVGKALARIEIDASAEVVPSPAVPAAQTTLKASEEPILTEAELKHPTPPYVPEVNGTATTTQNTTGSRFYSPLVRTIAKEEGITLAELDQIQGTGAEGRLTKNDLFDYLSQRSDSPKTVVTEKPKTIVKSADPQQKKSQPKAPVSTVRSGDEIVEMSKMRKLIADHMVMSKQTSPHATIFVEADVTNLVQWRNQAKKTFLQNEGEKLTFTPLFIEATTNAIKAYPDVNASVIDGHKIHYKKEINIGMATALPDGNLILPVVKDTASKSLTALAKDVNDLAKRARNSDLKPDDVVGGTFSITNIGTFDGLMGTPIINQPHVAILAVGAIKKRPVVLETEAGDVIAIRHMMYLSLSMDHRVVDGALGGAFLQKVKQELENWNVNRDV